MFENKAKGWYGSYSKVGRDSAEKYPMIMLKDQILNNQFKKIKIKDYFNTDDELENNKIIMEYNDDIFSKTYKRKTERKEKYKNICALKEENTMSDEYKYHQIHHKGLYDYNLIIKGQKKYQTNSSVNLPKDDLTTKRILTGPKWNSLTGRENNVLSKKEMLHEYYNSFDNIKNDKNIFEMKKQTKRGKLPVFYDLRIRIEEPFYKTSSPKKKKVIENKLSKTQAGESPKSEKSKISFKKFDEKKEKENHSLNFAKNISREKYYFLTRDRNAIRPFFIPNYNYVEQRSITTVAYNQKSNKNPPLKRKIGIESNLFFDPYKSLDKVNNHKNPNVLDLKSMEGREEDTNTEINLPGHMNNIHNRNSLEIMSKKTLKMNNYINGEIKSDYSSFNKKSFNSIINHNLLKKGKETDDIKFEKMTKKMNTNERIKRLMEFYSKNLDDESKFDNFKKIDGITFKSINNKVKLSEKEKKLFSLNFDY